MFLQLARAMVSELAHIVRPWRQAAAGQLVLHPGGLGLDATGADNHLFAPLWFAVPKKRVPRGKTRTRTADRTPRRITHYSMCIKCGKPKMNHKFCDNIELCASDSTSVQAER